MPTDPARRDPEWADDPRQDADLRRARAKRDAGLRRVPRLTGWVVAGAIALTGGLSEVAALALPGHSKRAVPQRQSSVPSPSIPAPSGAQDQAGSSLQPPEQAPQQSDAGGGGAAVSGGS